MLSELSVGIQVIIMMNVYLYSRYVIIWLFVAGYVYYIVFAALQRRAFAAHPYNYLHIERCEHNEKNNE